MADDEKEYNPSEDEGFLRAIDEVLDVPKEQEPIGFESKSSQIIDIPDKEEPLREELSDSEFSAYDEAVTRSLAGIFDEVAATRDETKEASSQTSEEKSAEEKSEPTDVGTTAKQGSFDSSQEDDEGTGSDFPEQSNREEDIIDDINAALALQVNEMNSVKAVKNKSKKWLLALIPLVGIVFLFTKFREGMPKWLMGVRIAVFSVFAFFVIGTIASGGKLLYNIAGSYIRWRMAGEATTPTPPGSLTEAPQSNPGNTRDETVVPTTPENKTNDDLESPVQPDGNAPRVEDHIVNILLLGEEKIGSEHGRGRTDLIMIATMDTEQRTFKLSSIMRDVLVAIPGHTDNRINAVYGMGGIDLLQEVIELNFEIVPDGYMLVGFDSFEKIIDNLGGVAVELSKEEADYLNTTNYISNPIYRNVVPGINMMNGNQVLGYCRVRKVPTINNKYADFGRTLRQRTVLNTLFEKIKEKNLFQLAVLADSCLPLVETNLSAAQISDYMEKAVENRITSFAQLRIPIDNSYSDATYNGITNLIQINFPDNIRELHEFIFGDYKEQ